MLEQRVLDPAVERDARPTETATPDRDRAASAAGSRPHRLGARGRDRDRELGGLVLDRVEPVRVGARLLEQPVARAQRAFQRVDARCVRRHRPRAPAGRESAAAREAGPPNRPSIAGVSQTTRRWSAKAAAEATGSRSMRHLRVGVASSRGGRLDAGAERREPERAFELGRRPPRTPSPSANATSSSVARRSPRPGREKRDRLEQIGLAGAVRADQHDRLVARRSSARRAIAAEIRQRQAADAGGGSHGVPIVQAIRRVLVTLRLAERSTA